MRKNRRFRTGIKHSVPVILFCLVSAGVFAQRAPEQYLSPAIVENYIAGIGISNGLAALAHHKDKKVQKRYDEYARQITDFMGGLGFFLSIRKNDPMREYVISDDYDVAKAYRAVLQVRVPPEVKAVYLENGLGKRGHQASLCLYLGMIATGRNQMLPTVDDSADRKELQEQITILSSLIHPKDLALIEEYFDRLQELR